MNIEALPRLLNVLHTQNCTVACPDALIGSVFHVEFEYEGRLVNESISVLLALRPEQYNQILLGAINGNLVDIATVSNMYACGFGMPLDTEKALAWASYATLDAAQCSTYAESVLALKADRKMILETCMSEGMIVPESILRLAEKIATVGYKSKPYTGQELKKGYHITPSLPGVKVTLIYRAFEVEGKQVTRLYGVLLPEQDRLEFSRTLHHHFDVPSAFGEIRGNNIIPSYDLFGKTVKLYCVQGSLTTPKSMIEARNAQFPEYASVRALMTAVVEGKVPSDSTVIESCKHTVQAALKAKVSKYAKALSSLREAKAKKAVVAEAERKLARAQSRLESESCILEAAKKEAMPQLPRTYLQFRATELFVCGKNGALKNAKLAKDLESHLQYLGFRSFNTTATAFVKHSGAKSSVLTESELDNVIDKFNAAYEGEHRITAVHIRPYSDSVNIHKQYSYKRSKETAK